MQYYAPFYRPMYYNNQMQNTPETMPQYNQQYQQAILPQIQTTPAISNDFLWVLNENEATSYPVAPNNSVTLWDKNQPTIYIKSVNAQGVPSMRILDFTERLPNSPKTTQSSGLNNDNNFVTIDVFNQLKGEFEALTARFEEMQTKPTIKTKKAEVNE